MKIKKKPVLQPCAECPWNSQSRDDHLFWETGGDVENNRGYQPSYIIVSPAHISIVTVGLRSDGCSKGFNYLYIRVGALDAYNLKLNPNHTTLVFVAESEVWTSRGCITFLKWKGTGEEFAILTKLMMAQVAPTTVGQVKDFIKANRFLDLSEHIPLKPYQKHRFEYRGLKLGEYLSDHVDPDPALIAEFEKKTKLKLPADYRDFILETNGGHIKNRVFYIAKGLKKPRELSSFQRFERGPHLGRNPNDYFEIGPSGFLCIAYDNKNECLFIGLHDTIHGCIFSVSDNSEGFYSSLDDPAKRAKTRGVRLIANSFSEFIAGLKITDELI
jgi:hypothetical protein